MADILLKVSPDELKTESGEITALITKIRGEYERLKTIVEGTKGYWTGEASNAFQEYVRSIDTDMQKVLDRLSEHPKDLIEMAGIYIESEQEIAEFVSALPIDVIQ